MTSADPQLVACMFRLLATAQAQRIGYAEIDASTPEGIASVTMCAMPTAVFHHLKPYMKAFCDPKDIGRTGQ